MYEKTHYIFVGIMTILVLAVGLFAGHYIASQKIDYVKQINTQLTLESRGLQLKYEIAGNNICKLFDSEYLFEELYNIGAKLDYLENDNSKNNTEIVQLKEYYQILQVENWLLLKEYQERCSQSINTILYFYSNEGDCPQCIQQGHALTFIRKENPNIYVFSFDINNDNPGIAMLRTVYNVTSAPTLVINEVSLSGFRTADDILSIMTPQPEPVQE